MQTKLVYLLAFVVAFSISCEKSSENCESIIDIPKGFPEINFPEGNEFTQERWALGKRLFYDPILSIDSTLSCASCHKQELAFADDVAFSDGVLNRPGTRNAPSLANIVYHPYFTREGGVATLEMQVLVPIQEHNEFAYNIVEIAKKLEKINSYVIESEAAYGRSPDHYVITRAISNFERSLISGNSSYDKFAFQNKNNALSALEKEGMNLFFSDRTSCSTCHGGFNFSDYSFANNGLYELYEDPGRYRLTGNEEDKALFKVASLRNVALTPPYMHDGSIQTLEEVVAHYNAGGAMHPNKSEAIKPLSLSLEEQKALIAFLKSLTDESFVSDPKFRN